MVPKLLIAIGIVFVTAVVVFGEPIPGNVDSERIGVEWEHQEEDGAYRHHYADALWVQNGRSAVDRFGIAMQGPILNQISLGAAFGVVHHFNRIEETRDLSGRDYNGAGVYWRVGVWYNFRRAIAR